MVALGSTRTDLSSAQGKDAEQQPPRHACLTIGLSVPLLWLLRVDMKWALHIHAGCCASTVCFLCQL